MAIQIPPDGPSSARIMIVGESPGEDEERHLKPFLGQAGLCLEKMLHEAKISRSECFLTYVARERPPANYIENFFAKNKKQSGPQHKLICKRYAGREIQEGIELLRKEILLVRPNIIIALGNTALWALGGEKGIKKWRGSMMYEQLTGSNFKFIPTYPPNFVLGSWNVRSTTVQDLKRAGKYRNGGPFPTPDWRFIVRPSFEEAEACLKNLLFKLEEGNLILSFDIETACGHIHSAGIAWSLLDAICIPLMSISNRAGYWTLEEEAHLIYLMMKVLTHPNAEVVGQNIIYDCQYTWRWWHFVPRVTQDTMISQHAIFSDLPKSLAFQASMYAQYFVFWKDEAKELI